MIKNLKNLFWGTVYSIVIFFAISFITFLTQIDPINCKGHAPYKMDVGFPFIYYGQFWLRGSDFPNSGWHINYLFYDCLITWLVVTGIYMIVQRHKNKHI